MVKKAAKKVLAPVETPKLLKLDLGCGKRPQDGYEGVDILDFGQPHKVDLRKPWPWADNSVHDAVCSHFVEHLDSEERIHFVNELWRVLVPGGKCLVVTPHWNSARAYGDLTHKWPPVCEWWYYYLSKEWRDTQAPHTNEHYTCNFAGQGGHGMHHELLNRPPDFQQFALKWYKDAATDLIMTIIAIK